MIDIKNKSNDEEVIKAMFDAGAHFGYSRSKRHPSMKDVIFGVKSRIELFDLEKTKSYFDTARSFIQGVVASGKQVLFISSKNEAKDSLIKEIAPLGEPYVAGRWIGGALTNYVQIKTRMAKLLDLKEKRVKGELAKYTKKERLIIDREISDLEEMFGGLLPMKEMPGALFVIDSTKEKTAVSEARRMKIPVVAILGSDCDLSGVTYPIPANDSSTSSIKYFVSEFAKIIKEVKKTPLSK